MALDLNDPAVQAAIEQERQKFRARLQQAPPQAQTANLTEEDLIPLVAALRRVGASPEELIAAQQAAVDRANARAAAAAQAQAELEASLAARKKGRARTEPMAQRGPWTIPSQTTQTLGPGGVTTQTDYPDRTMLFPPGHQLGFAFTPGPEPPAPKVRRRYANPSPDELQSIKEHVARLAGKRSSARAARQAELERRHRNRTEAARLKALQEQGINPYSFDAELRNERRAQQELQQALSNATNTIEQINNQANQAQVTPADKPELPPGSYVYDPAAMQQYMKAPMVPEPVTVPSADAWRDTLTTMAAGGASPAALQSYAGTLPSLLQAKQQQALMASKLGMLKAAGGLPGVMQDPARIAMGAAWTDPNAPKPADTTHPLYQDLQAAAKADPTVGGQLLLSIAKTLNTPEGRMRYGTVDRTTLNGLYAQAVQAGDADTARAINTVIQQVARGAPILTQDKGSQKPPSLLTRLKNEAQRTMTKYPVSGKTPEVPTEGYSGFIVPSLLMP